MLAVRRKGVVRTKLEQRTPVGLVLKRACTTFACLCSLRSFRSVLFLDFYSLSSYPLGSIRLFRSRTYNVKNSGAILVSSFFYKDFRSALIRPIYAECALRLAGRQPNRTGSSRCQENRFEQFSASINSIFIRQVM